MFLHPRACIDLRPTINQFNRVDVIHAHKNSTTASNLILFYHLKLLNMPSITVRLMSDEEAIDFFSGAY